MNMACIYINTLRVDKTTVEISEYDRNEETFVLLTGKTLQILNAAYIKTENSILVWYPAHLTESQSFRIYLKWYIYFK